jgi:hypothetical protein
MRRGGARRRQIASWPLPGMHLATPEENILGLLDGSCVDRQRTTDVDDSLIRIQAIRGRCARLELDLTDALTNLPAEVLVRDVGHPRPWPAYRLRGPRRPRHATEHMQKAEPDLPRDLMLGERT